MGRELKRLDRNCVDAAQVDAQIGKMKEASNEDLELIARDAACYVVGVDMIDEVKVVPSLDSDDRPVYWFNFLVDQDRVKMNLGRIMISLIQKLTNDLDQRGDGHYPLVRLLDRKDWEKHAGA